MDGFDAVDDIFDLLNMHENENWLMRNMHSDICHGVHGHHGVLTLTLVKILRLHANCSK